MNWYEFVFSGKKSFRYARHIVFWLVWALYFLISMDLLPNQTNAPPPPDYSLIRFTDFIHLLLTLSIHIAACYIFIYFFLPRYLLKGKYILFVTGLLLLGFIMIQSSRLIDTVIIPLLRKSPDRPVISYYTSVFSGLVSAIKIIVVATGIKLIKYWWQKQKEKERLEKERIETELQLLKAQIHPGFLFSSLKNIYSFASAASPKASEMLLRLSDLLSYMLYECNDKMVALDKELKMIKNYLVLEKIRYEGNLELNMSIKGEPAGKKIAPLLLLGLIEYSARQCSPAPNEQPWINLEIQVKSHILYVKLMNGKSSEPPADTNIEGHDELVMAKRRLDLLYPGNHELQIVEEAEILMINLEINLEPGLAEDGTGNAENADLLQQIRSMG